MEVFEYQKEYPMLNLKFKKENEKDFENGLICCYILELENGFKVKKVNKTNNKGTKITYTKIKSEEENTEYMKSIDDMIDKFNEKYNITEVS